MEGLKKSIENYENGTDKSIGGTAYTLFKKELKQIEDIVGKDEQNHIRKEFGYTQQDLSEKISVMQSTISKYEIGLIGIPIDFLISLSLLYNKSLGSLMGLED